MNKKSRQNVIKIIDPKAGKATKKAFATYDRYKDTMDILDRTNLALGRKGQYQSKISSTLNIELNLNGAISTKKNI